MKALLKELLHLTEVRQLTEDVRGGVSPVLVTGVGPVHRAQVEAALHRDSGRPLWVLCADEREARRQAGDLAVLTWRTAPWWSLPRTRWCSGASRPGCWSGRQ